MTKKNEIILMKLGGSLLTNKNEPFSLRTDVIENIIDQISKSNERIILIHGGGSFGHPIAKKYNIQEGLDLSINNQILGLAETHEAMNKFNSYIISKFLEKNMPMIPIQPSTLFVRDSSNIIFKSIEPIQIALDLGIMPVLYGDIIFDMRGSFGIISGDQIILELCKSIDKYFVSKVIFCIDQDGLYVKDDENDEKSIKLATNINFIDLDKLKLANLGEKIDVTGGIRGKIKSIKEICNLSVPVQIVNGLKENYIYKALKSQAIPCTFINVIPTTGEKKQAISVRKFEHLKIPLQYNVQHSENYFKYIKFMHHALPEIDFNQIDLSVKFYNKSISAPICIAAITGGHPTSREINKILAEAAESENIIMSVGSQRAGLEDESAVDSFRIVREVAPTIPIIGNIGIGQVSELNFKVDDFIKCIEMIKADVMAIHFNALHELVQSKGDRSYRYFYENFRRLRKAIKIPIIAKEVGSGFSEELAMTLDKLGFDGFDIGGAGGTSFAAIESIRNKDNNFNFTRNPAEIFREWGIPTPVSICYVRKVSQKIIIATGGLQNGTDIAKSIALGADIGGFAYKFLQSSWKDYINNSISNTINEIKTLKNELRSCLWLMNLKDVNSLKNNHKKTVKLGKFSQWFNQ